MTAICSLLSEIYKLSASLLDFFRSRKWLDCGFACLVDAELLTSKISSPLSHKTVSHELTSSNGNKARYSVTLLVVKTNDASADASARRVIICSDQRTDAGISAEDSGICKLRSEFFSFAKKKIHLISGNLHIINFLVWYTAGSRTDKGYCITRHKNIRIRRLAAAVQYQIIDPMSKNKESTLCREHIDCSTGHLGDEMSPDTAGIYYQSAAELLLLLCVMVKHLNTHNSFTLLDESHNLRILHDLSAMKTGVKGVGYGKAEWVNSSIRHSYCTDERRVYRRLQTDRLFRVDSLSADSRSQTRIYESALESEVVLRQSDEKSVSLLDTVTGHFAQNHILADTLFCRLLIGNCITGTTMKKTMVSSGRSVCKVVPLKQEGLEATHGTVSCRARASDTSSDNDYIVLFRHCGILFISLCTL